MTIYARIVTLQATFNAMEEEAVVKQRQKRRGRRNVKGRGTQAQTSVQKRTRGGQGRDEVSD
jgi:hypothetical protein